MIVNLLLGDELVGIESSDVIPWIMGYGVKSDKTRLLLMAEDGKPDVTLLVSTTGSGGRYVVNSADDVSHEWSIPESWALPWARGLAAAHGVDLARLLSDYVECRALGTKAMMLCDHLGWIKYIRHEREDDHGCIGK